jgi:hypothetical protein
VTPKRRSARKPAAAAPQSTGKMLAAAGFAYTPNAALAGRLAAAADGRPVLGDAMDADLLASMDEVRTGPSLAGEPLLLFGESSGLSPRKATYGLVTLKILKAAPRSSPDPGFVSSRDSPWDGQPWCALQMMSPKAFVSLLIHSASAGALGK